MCLSPQNTGSTPAISLIHWVIRIHSVTQCCDAKPGITEHEICVYRNAPKFQAKCILHYQMPELTFSVAVGSPTALLTDLSLQLPANQLGLIYGRSGAGKTTLLQLLAGLTDTTSGQISLGSGANETLRTCCCSVAYCCGQVAVGHLCMFALLLLLVLNGLWAYTANCKTVKLTGSVSTCADLQCMLWVGFACH